MPPRRGLLRGPLTGGRTRGECFLETFSIWKAINGIFDKALQHRCFQIAGYVETMGAERRHVLVEVSCQRLDFAEDDTKGGRPVNRKYASAPTL
jgi:hypothetical protein